MAGRTFLLQDQSLAGYSGEQLHNPSKIIKVGTFTMNSNEAIADSEEFSMLAR